MFVLMGSIFLMGNNTTEARTDYYIGYDSSEGCDLYFDVDSIGYKSYDEGIRYSWATIHWTNGKTWEGMGAGYNPSTGDYYFSGGVGGFKKVTPGYLDYKFCVLCDRFAYEK